MCGFCIFITIGSPDKHYFPSIHFYPRLPVFICLYPLHFYARYWLTDAAALMPPFMQAIASPSRTRSSRCLTGGGLAGNAVSAAPAIAALSIARQHCSTTLLDSIARQHCSTTLPDNITLQTLAKTLTLKRHVIIPTRDLPRPSIRRR